MAPLFEPRFGSSDLPHSTSFPDVAALARAATRTARCDRRTWLNAIHDRILPCLPFCLYGAPVFMKWLWPVSLVSEERQSAVPATLT